MKLFHSPASPFVRKVVILLHELGQIAVGAALAYLDFRHDARGWREGNAELAAWFEGFESRPSMQATRPPEA